MNLSQFLEEWNSDSPTITVCTSGSTGKPKPITVEKKHMVASATMTCNFFDLHSGDTALLCMPLDFIAGKMMVVRSLVRNLNLISVAPSAHPLSKESLGDCRHTAFDFIAMTPMQVFSTLQNEDERQLLLKTRNLLIGGGAISPELEQQLKSFPNAVWSSYAMTETLSHIALRRINGNKASLWYTPMQGITIGLTQEGCLWIDAPKIASERITTNDIAIVDEKTMQFKIIGRRDNVICSGGIKIQIEEMEQTLSPYINVPFTITKKEDAKYGEIAVMLIAGSATDKAHCEHICQATLPKYWVPKEYKCVKYIPQTPTGKPDRATALSLAKEV